MNKKMTKKKTRFSIDNLIENSKFSFTRNLKYFIIAPIVIIVVGIILLCTLGFNLGFDFTGGTNMTIYLNDATSGSSEFSDQSYNLENNYDEVVDKINNVLANYDVNLSSIQTTEINIDADRGYSFTIVNGDAIIIKFQNGDMTEEEVESQNNEIQLALLKEFGYFDGSATTDDLTSNEFAAFVANGGVTTASATSQLLMNSFIALLVAVVLILIYVAIRFEITSGLAAILALFHDILITTSFMLIFRIPINTPFIAALITILGYSINNTIIIFDRIRENVKLSKNLGKIDNYAVADNAVRSTMMRTILTTVTTFIMIFFITVIGVSDIQQFAFPIMIGILSGFYSSNFLTTGLWAIAYRPSKRKLAKIAEKEKQKEKRQQYEV